MDLGRGRPIGRTMYNRASADPDGRPWSERKKMVWWDERKGEWTGNDIPDFPKTKPPMMRPDYARDPKGMDAHVGRRSFHHGGRWKVPVVLAIRTEGWSVANSL